MAWGGTRPPSETKLLDVSAVTDGLLIVSLEAVEAAVAAMAGTQLNGRAKFRLLARLVAGAVGATAVLSDDDKLLAGKRLETQATRQTKLLVQMAKEYDERRDARRAEAAVSTDLEAGLEAALAEIDAKERRAFTRIVTEVYTGFVELGELDVAAAPAPCPAVVTRAAEQPLPGYLLPAWLRKELGDAGCVAIEEDLAGFRAAGFPVWPTEDDRVLDPMAACLWWLANRVRYEQEMCAHHRKVAAESLKQCEVDLADSDESCRQMNGALSCYEVRAAKAASHQVEELEKMRQKVWEAEKERDIARAEKAAVAAVCAQMYRDALSHTNST